MLQTQQALPRSHPVPHWAGSPHNWPGKPTPSFETSSQIFNLNHEFMTQKKQKDPKSAVSPLKLGNLRYLFTKTWDFTSLTNQNREISGECSFCQGLSGTAHTTPRGNVEGEECECPVIIEPTCLFPKIRYRDVHSQRLKILRT